MTISKLVKKAKRGNKDALVQLILQEQQQFYHLAYTFVGSEDGVTEITIQSEPNVIYDDISLQTTEGDVSLQTTKDFHESEGDYTRTLRFNTTDEATDLLIKNMYFVEMQNDTITIFD